MIKSQTKYIGGETKKSTARKYGYPEVTCDNNEEVIVNLKIANKHNNYKRDNYKHNNYKRGTGQDRCTTGPDRTSATLFNTWQFRWQYQIEIAT